MRLNQAIARSGYCSRRHADELIAAGKVFVNGELVLDFSRQVDPFKDELKVEGRRLSFARHIYVLLHKPPGVVTSMSDESGRETVMDLLPEELRTLRPVGRLDMFSEGLLLLSNDGHFIQELTHPSKHLPKKYEIKVKGAVPDRDLHRMAEGVMLEDGLTLPAKVKLLVRNKSFSEFEISITEGRNRQLRRMCAELGYTVVRLRRLGIGRLQLGLIPSGSWRYLTDDEVRLLLPKTTGN
ncbi:MAG: rRNA pseudouridine synthase [Candidatus Obscuribacterales bacterium]|nr:rRNA pseudouridine synthase [Candidatus Obscuribacterales bacterium]